ncbi:unnamed protein product [Moneuplotes crassus]|uniref:DBF4-type domain-containing protein n=1 Tax=Euplotes crassus TaxID=5936 RepID=A0AAD1Y8B2_EUPCR|nr:unnamed protein product [Moneuplotes crassus]
MTPKDKYITMTERCNRIIGRNSSSKTRRTGSKIYDLTDIEEGAKTSDPFASLMLKKQAPQIFRSLLNKREEDYQAFIRHNQDVKRVKQFKYNLLFREAWKRDKVVDVSSEMSKYNGNLKQRFDTKADIFVVCLPDERLDELVNIIHGRVQRETTYWMFKNEATAAPEIRFKLREKGSINKNCLAKKSARRKTLLSPSHFIPAEESECKEDEEDDTITIKMTQKEIDCINLYSILLQGQNAHSSELSNLILPEKYIESFLIFYRKQRAEYYLGKNFNIKEIEDRNREFARRAKRGNLEIKDNAINHIFCCAPDRSRKVKERTKRNNGVEFHVFDPCGIDKNGVVRPDVNLFEINTPRGVTVFPNRRECKEIKARMDMIKSSHYRAITKLKQTPKIEKKIRIPEPNHAMKYCKVCDRYYQKYLEHIDSQNHKLATLGIINRENYQKIDDFFSELNKEHEDNISMRQEEKEDKENKPQNFEELSLREDSRVPPKENANSSSAISGLPTGGVSQEIGYNALTKSSSKNLRIKRNHDGSKSYMSKTRIQGKKSVDNGEKFSREELNQVDSEQSFQIIISEGSSVEYSVRPSPKNEDLKRSPKTALKKARLIM